MEAGHTSYQFVIHFYIWNVTVANVVCLNKVTKPMKMMKLSRWKTKQQQGVQFWEQLGNDSRRRKIFGNEYDAFVSALNGVEPLPPPDAIVPAQLPPLDAQTRKKDRSAADTSTPTVASGSQSRSSSKRENTHCDPIRQPLVAITLPAGSQRPDAKRSRPVEVLEMAEGSSQQKRRKYNGPPLNPDDIIDLT
jgi:hypothetical protein